MNQGPRPTLASFCEELEGRVGTSAVEHLAWWVRHVFHKEVQAHIPVQNWRDLMRRCRREGEESWRRLPFPGQLWRRVEAIRRINRPQGIQATGGALEDHPLSDWDLHMYASQTYDFGDTREGPSPNPSTEVFLTVGVYQQYLFWAWALRRSPRSNRPGCGTKPSRLSGRTSSPGLKTSSTPRHWTSGYDHTTTVRSSFRGSDGTVRTSQGR